MILAKKWGILIKEESESLDFIGLKIPRDYKKHLEEIEEALDSFLKTKIQERNICCNDISGICRKIKLDTLLLIETSGRKLRYLMVYGKEYFCEGNISEMSQSLEQFGFFSSAKVICYQYEVY